jgi:hypothetical protein
VGAQVATGQNVYPDPGFSEFPRPSRQLPRQCLEVGHDRFLPYPLQFIHNYGLFNSSIC